MAEVSVYLSGCDDTTVVILELDDAEQAALRRVARESRKVGGGCQPVMNVGDDEYTEWLQRG